MPRILLIEDDDDERPLLKQVLEQHGYEVEEATSGTGALHSYAISPPDLIVTDLIMPGTEGIEVIMKLRKQNSNVKIIAISGGDYLDLAMRLGADCTIRKPFSDQALLDAVKETLGSSTHE